MTDLNLTIASGVLRADPELRYLPSGTLITTATLVIERPGDGGPHRTSLPIVAWGDLAERLGRDVSRGDRIVVTGSLRNRKVSDGPPPVWRTELHITALDLGRPSTAGDANP